MSEFSVGKFYEGIADKYNWFFSSRSNIMERQASQIIPILEQFNVKTILDCSCGDGLQAIPLARHGYSVDGGDISAGMVKKAIEYARKENLNIDFKEADFRELEKKFTKTFDCVLTMGNSIPHLMTDEDIRKALISIYNRINPNGIAIVEMRDYDKMLEEKNRFMPMRINDIQGGFRYSILYIFDYLPNTIRFNVVYLIEYLETSEKFMEQDSVELNPIKQVDFIKNLQDVGFVNVDYKDGIYIAQKHHG